VRHVLVRAGMLEIMTAAPKFTVDDLLALGEDVRAELIDGEIVYKNAPSGKHALAQVYLDRWLGRRFHRTPGGRWPGGWWVVTEIHVVYEASQTYCHDIAGWKRANLEQLPDGWVEQRPDWVCEILSPGHERDDLIDKLLALHAAGVPHYWVIDREKRRLLLHDWNAEGYRMRVVQANEVISAAPFEACELRTAVIFGDEDDEE
jgi:Uma2 family endonuclease